LRTADIRAGLYHGRMSARDRHEAQNGFMEGSLDVMVATNAFGLGVDKPDVRYGAARADARKYRGLLSGIGPRRTRRRYVAQVHAALATCAIAACSSSFLVRRLSDAGQIEAVIVCDCASRDGRTRADRRAAPQALPDIAMVKIKVADQAARRRRRRRSARRRSA
jgi:hypothetical protein